MHLSAVEEYGLRCLLQLARHSDQEPRRIREIAAAEGLTPQYVAKLMRVLREGGLVCSTRGARGGYHLARPTSSITTWEVLEVLGGGFFRETFCDDHSGALRDCIHSTDCSIRSLWRWVARSLQKGLESVTLKDLLREETCMAQWLDEQLAAVASGAVLSSAPGAAPGSNAEAADPAPLLLDQETQR